MTTLDTYEFDQNLHDLTSSLHEILIFFHFMFFGFFCLVIC
jgi:hypothetical protein